MRAFISYGRKDEDQAIRLFEDLCRVGIEAWIDKRSLLPGQDWELEIERAIKASDFVILLLSAASLDRRGYIHKEIRLALDAMQRIPHGRIYLIPIRLEACHIPEPLAPIQWVDFFPSKDAGFASLLRALRAQGSLLQQTRLGKTSPYRTTESSIPSILVVNDAPATMSSVVDHWKYCGIEIDFAFSVREACTSIQKELPTVVVSDLSHFSYGNLVTDRAAFDILNWARQENIDLDVIIFCADLTPERTSDAERLGAVGICDNATELYMHLSNVIGRPLVTIEHQETYLDPEVIEAGKSWLARKSLAKSALQDAVGWSRNDQPIVCFIGRFVHQNGFDLVISAISSIADLGARLLVIGAGDHQLESALVEAKRAHPHSVEILIGFDEALARKAEMGADIRLAPALLPTFELKTISGNSRQYGTLPVILPTSSTDEILDISDGGTVFLATAPSRDEILKALRRALDLYKSPGQWLEIQKRAVDEVVRWNG